MGDEIKKQFKSIMSGGMGGICLVVVGHPLDLIKVNLQTQKEGVKMGMGDVFKKIMRTEGIRGFYKGMATPLLGITPVTATYFWGYDIGCRILKKFNSDPNQSLSTLQIALAGGFSAIPGTVLMTPIERVKCILQIQNSEGGTPKYSGPTAVIKDIMKTDGLRGLYKGTVATLARDVPGSVMWFGVYEVLKAALTDKETGHISPISTLIAGGMAGCANWAVSIPPDVIKSRLQTAEEGKYSGFVDCVLKTIKKEGPAALFKGLGPAMVRAFPANAACFYGAEVARGFLNNVWP